MPHGKAASFHSHLMLNNTDATNRLPFIHISRHVNSNKERGDSVAETISIHLRMMPFYISHLLMMICNIQWASIPTVFIFNSWLFVRISSYFSHLFWAFAHQIGHNIKNQSTYIFMTFPAEQKTAQMKNI